MTKKRKRRVNLGLAARAHLDRAQDFDAFGGRMITKLQDALRDVRCDDAIDVYHRAATALGEARAHLASVEAGTADERFRKHLVSKAILIGHQALAAERTRLKKFCVCKGKR